MRVTLVSLAIAMLGIMHRPVWGQDRPASRGATVPFNGKVEGKAAVVPSQTALVAAPSQLTDRPEDEKAIRATAEAFIKAYNSGNAKAMAALFATDSEVIDEYGDRIVGPDKIEDEYSALFELTPRSKLDLTTESLRFLGADAAKEEGQIRLQPGDGGSLSVRRYVVFYVKRDGKWQYSFVREDHDVTLSPRERLEPLQWLAGDWLDESDDAVVQVHSDWSKDGNFLLRDFTVHIQGKPAMTVNERIGWDPLSRQIKSWVFDSSGGYGEGLWTQDATGWIIKSTGVLPDGRLAAATHIIARLNKNTYRWASLERTVGGRVVPETESYVMVRTPPSPRSAVKAR
jgi:uncharacterized protein (TIGR02246 family)